MNDNGLSNKLKHLINRMFSNILAFLFLISLTNIFLRGRIKTKWQRSNIVRSWFYGV